MFIFLTKRRCLHTRVPEVAPQQQILTRLPCRRAAAAAARVIMALLLRCAAPVRSARLGRTSLTRGSSHTCANCLVLPHFSCHT